MAAQDYNIQYAPEAVEDVRKLRPFDRQKILDAIERHLRLNPTQVSRTRIKRTVQPFWSQYRLRVDDFRVYYDVDEQQRAVNILRILEKGTSETPGRQTDEAD